MSKEAIRKHKNAFLIASIRRLSDDLKATLLIGKDFKPEKAVALEIKKFKLGRIKGLAIDLVAGSKGSVGAGISKKIYSHQMMEIGAGIYMTRNVNQIFKQPLTKLPDIKIGISAKFGFNKGNYISSVLKKLRKGG